jgi:hypothetical protein
MYGSASLDDALDADDAFPHSHHRSTFLLFKKEEQKSIWAYNVSDFMCTVKGFWYKESQRV